MPFWNRTTVLIPALNEAACVAETVARWRAAGFSHVLVVDNGSTDGTAAVAARAGALVVSELRRGYGAAAWRGLQHLPPDTEWVLFSSADGSDHLTPDELQQWQAAVDAGCDLVVGDRVSLAVSREHLKAVQSFGNRLCCTLIALGWRRRFADMGSLRLLRVSTLRKLNLQDRSFGWNVEMQVRAIEQGIRIVELPVGYHPRRAGESKISGSFMGTLRAGRSILWMMLKLWLTRRH
jgi:glycosyltransferase involved in cell wall biosynthesis